MMRQFLLGLLITAAMFVPGNAQEVGTLDFATNQVSVAATAGGTLVADYRQSRESATIVNMATTDVFCGKSGVTTSTGQLLAGVKGQAITIRTRAAIYCIVATGTENVSIAENF